MLPPPIPNCILPFLMQHRFLTLAHYWWLYLSACYAEYILFCKSSDVPYCRFVAPASRTLLDSKFTRSPVQITSPATWATCTPTLRVSTSRTQPWATAISNEHKLETTTQFNFKAKPKRAPHFLNKRIINNSSNMNLSEVLQDWQNETRMKVVLFGITMPFKWTFQWNTEEDTKFIFSEVVPDATFGLISKRCHIKQKINVFVYTKSLLELVYHESNTGLTPLSLLFQWKFIRNNIPFLSLHPGCGILCIATETKQNFFFPLFT